MLNSAYKVGSLLCQSSGIINPRSAVLTDPQKPCESSTSVCRVFATSLKWRKVKESLHWSHWWDATQRSFAKHRWLGTWDTSPIYPLSDSSLDHFASKNQHTAHSNPHCLSPIVARPLSPDQAHHCLPKLHTAPLVLTTLMQLSLKQWFLEGQHQILGAELQIQKGPTDRRI